MTQKSTIKKLQQIINHFKHELQLKQSFKKYGESQFEVNSNNTSINNANSINKKQLKKNIRMSVLKNP